MEELEAVAVEKEEASEAIEPEATNGRVVPTRTWRSRLRLSFLRPRE